MLWVPSIEFPLIVKIIFFILLIPFFCFISVLGGLTRAVAAGRGSVTGILNEFIEMVNEKPKDKNN